MQNFTNCEKFSALEESNFAQKHSNKNQNKYLFYAPGNRLPIFWLTEIAGLFHL